MADIINIPPGTNALTDLVIAENGVWKKGEPRRVAGFSEIYYKADLQEWWVWDGSTDKKLTIGGIESRVPTFLSSWPPVVTDDLVIGDWFIGPYKSRPLGQVARFMGSTRPDPFHYFLLDFIDEPGQPLLQPRLSARLTASRTVRMLFPVTNPIERLTAIWVYRYINGQNEKLMVFPPDATEEYDTDLGLAQNGDTIIYQRVDVEGTGMNQVLSEKSIPSVVLILEDDLGPLVFTVTEAFGHPASFKRITILNPTTSGFINYDWSVYRGDAYAGGQFMGSASFVASDGVFDVDLTSFGLLSSMTDLRFYLAQSWGVDPGRRESWQPFSVSEDLIYLDPPTELVAGFIQSGNYVQLHWKDNTPFETGYDILRSTDGGEFVRLNGVGVDVTSYQDYNVINNPGKNYQYQVVATRGTLRSEPSNIAEVVMGETTLAEPKYVLIRTLFERLTFAIDLDFGYSNPSFYVDIDIVTIKNGQTTYESKRGLYLNPFTWTIPWETGITVRKIRFRNVSLSGLVSKWTPYQVIKYDATKPDSDPSRALFTYEYDQNAIPVTMPVRSASEYLSGLYNPHDTLGAFRRIVRNFGPLFDTVGTWGNIPYNFIRDKQGFSWLGVTATGPYWRKVEFEDAYYEREESPDTRFVTLHQNVIEATNPDYNNSFRDPNPAPVGHQFTTDAGVNYTVTEAMRQAYWWNIGWAVEHRDGSALNGDSRFRWIRGNMENHNIVYGMAPGYYDVARYIWGGGTQYAPARAGGTDPFFSNLTDAQWVDWLVLQQATYNAWLSTVLGDQIPKLKFMLYGDGQGAFVQNGGLRLDQTFFKNTQFGKPCDKFVASSHGWSDTLLMAAPFFIARTDKQGNDGQNIFADLCIADGWPATDTIVSGEPEFFRYSVSDTHPNGRVTVRFEDKNGNLCPTKKTYILENDYGGSGQKETVPIGTTVYSYNNASRLPNWFFNSSVDDFVDDSLVNYFWHYCLSIYATRKPLVHQIYPWMISLRHQGIPNETSFTAQLPKRLVHGLNLLGQIYKVVQIWYQLQMYNDINGGQNSVGVCRTLDALYESNFWICDFNAHFNRSETTKVVEISMDGGTTWTNGNQIIRNTAYAPDHYKYAPDAYSGDWIRARRSAAQASPLVMVSYNQFTGSYVIFEKCVFGPSISYSMRVKNEKDQYVYFNNRTVGKDWKRTIQYV